MEAKSPSYLHSLFSLSGRVALCTGASSGIGEHIARVLAQAGASVVLVGRQIEKLKATVAEISSEKVACLPVDLQEAEALEKMAERAGHFFGAPDILINAAGVNFREPAESITWQSWEATLRLNLSVPFFLARLLVPGMRQKGEGNIINIASLQSFRAFPNSAAYGASKGGIAQLTRAMAEAWSQEGIVTNAIAPGFFKTALTAPVFSDESLARHHARQTAIGRNGAFHDLDGAVVFLASRSAGYVTGQVLPVDGGYSIK